MVSNVLYSIIQVYITYHSAQVKRFTPKENGSSAHAQGMISTGAQSIGIEDPASEAGSKKMKSVLEMDDLSDFLVQAQLANKDFVSEREQLSTSYYTIVLLVLYCVIHGQRL